MRQLDRCRQCNAERIEDGEWSPHKSVVQSNQSIKRENKSTCVVAYLLCIAQLQSKLIGWADGGRTIFAGASRHLHADWSAAGVGHALALTRMPRTPAGPGNGGHTRRFGRSEEGAIVSTDGRLPGIVLVDLFELRLNTGFQWKVVDGSCRFLCGQV